MNKLRSLSVCISIVIFCAGAARPQVTAHYLNVGQASCALVEFDSGLIMIDAGGETTSERPSGEAYRRHLIAYIGEVLAAHPAWNKTIEAIIVSHPHRDHTMFLMDVMRNFTVHTLIDNGAECGSGIGDLKKARSLAAQKQIHYMAVRDKGIHGGGFPVHLLEADGPDAPKIVLLSGGRNCLNANNDSISVRIVAKEATLLFVGDSENEDTKGQSKCAQILSKCVPELSMLGEKYGGNGLLRADLYHVAHHGSPNGTTPDFMKTVSPLVTVISAGEALRAKPGGFHAWEFGHPRDKAVTAMIESTRGERAKPADVPVFTAANTASAKKVSPPATVSISKAVYCTSWDGDIKVAFARGAATPIITTDGFRPSIPLKDRARQRGGK